MPFAIFNLNKNSYYKKGKNRLRDKWVELDKATLYQNRRVAENGFCIWEKKPEGGWRNTRKLRQGIIIKEISTTRYVQDPSC